MRGYEARMIDRSRRMRDDLPPTMAEIDATIYRVELTPPAGMRATCHVLAYSEAHAIEVATAREHAPADTRAVATVSPCHGLDEAETKRALFIGESVAEREARRERHRMTFGAVR